MKSSANRNYLILCRVTYESFSIEIDFFNVSFCREYKNAIQHIIIIDDEFNI